MVGASEKDQACKNPNVSQRHVMRTLPDMSRYAYTS